MIIRPLEFGLGSQFMEWRSNHGETTDEATVMTTHAKESPDLFECFGSREVNNGFDFIRVNSDSLSTDDVTEEGELLEAKVALARFKCESMGGSSCEDLIEPVD